MHNLRDIIGRLAKGDVILAEFLNRIADAATRENLPPDGWQDGTGAYPARFNPSVHWRLVKTCANPQEGPYPKAEDRPDTYWCKFLTPDFTNTPLQQGYKAPGFLETTEALGLVHWLGNRYVPEGTIMRAWHVAPGRPPIIPNSRADMWVAFDQQQVATFVVFELVDPLNKTDATVKAKFLEYWDGQKPWDSDDNPDAEFNVVNTGMIFPWEWNLTQYPAGTKGIACLDPESGAADPISYRILFMAQSADDGGSVPTPSDPGLGVEVCIPTCGYVDSEGCYVVTERTYQFPPGTTYKDGYSRRLMMCVPGTASDTPSNPPPSFPSMPSSPLTPDYFVWHQGAAGAGYWMLTPEIGIAGDVRWQKGDRDDPTPPVEGSYAPGTLATGTATVSDGGGGFSLNVSGTLDPDTAGHYTFTGQYLNGLGIWKRTGSLP